MTDGYSNSLRNFVIECVGFCTCRSAPQCDAESLGGQIRLSAMFNTVSVSEAPGVRVGAARVGVSALHSADAASRWGNRGCGYSPQSATSRRSTRPPCCGIKQRVHFSPLRIQFLTHVQIYILQNRSDGAAGNRNGGRERTVRGEGEGRSEGDAGWGLFAGQGAGREDAAGNSDGVQQWERTAGKRGAGQGREGHSGEGEGVALTATSVSNRALHLSPFSLPAPPPFSPQRSPDTLPNVAGGS